MICSICKEEKTSDLFYKKKPTQCKPCLREKGKIRLLRLKNDPVWVEKERLRHKDKYIRLGYKERHKPSREKKASDMKKYHDKYPEKKAAALVMKHNKPQTKGNHYHHWSYNEVHYKDVIELSHADHVKVHRYMIYDQERKMYRRSDNNILLDTKEANIEFINYLKDKP